MISTSVKLAKNLHQRMGYPLGKMQYKMQLYAGIARSQGGPMRHVRRVKFKILNLKEVLMRKRCAVDMARDLAPEMAKRIQEYRDLGFSNITDQVDAKLLEELMQYYQEVLVKRSETVKPVPTHPFFFMLADQNDFATDNILIRFALQDSILAAVSAYFGSVPILNSMSVTESRSVKIESKKLRASQQWHLDYSAGGDDIASIWVYLTDVNTVDQGPLTYLPIPDSRKVKNDLFPRRIEDEEIEASGLADKVKRIVGPRLTVFLINTHKCYHMGSRLKEGEKRVAYMIDFARTGEKGIPIKVTTPVPKELKKLVLAR